MKHTSALLLLVALTTSASAEPAGEHWLPNISAGTKCPVQVTYADSTFPSPFPSGNYVRIQLADGAGYLNVMNFEVLTKVFNYNGKTDCDIQVGPLPKEPEQGFYCYLGIVQGVHPKGGFTQIMGRTAGQYIKFNMYGAIGANRQLQLKDLCKGSAPACVIQLQGTCMHHTMD